MFNDRVLFLIIDMQGRYESPQLLHVNAKLKNSKKDTVIVFNLLLSNGMIIKEVIDYVYIYSV
ncbi:hypothetical protein [Bacillus thuringiensis]|uniref:hypothetical protein n=1 Tax=Bacillus thuringiensis TaxID=1428 RepID=UPI000BF2AC0D|nr:hypothetical protein [Bacillus thuringiensis]PEQ27229.1 hypothetical protein CN471_30635 [Bacillus thuringiensis]